jgi:hypothetical protein
MFADTSFVSINSCKYENTNCPGKWTGKSEFQNRLIKEAVPTTPPSPLLSLSESYLADLLNFFVEDLCSCI